MRKVAYLNLQVNPAARQVLLSYPVQHFKEYEETEARLMNDLYDAFLEAGKSDAEARQLAGIG